MSWYFLHGSFFVLDAEDNVTCKSIISKNILPSTSQLCHSSLPSPFSVRHPTASQELAIEWYAERNIKIILKDSTQTFCNFHTILCKSTSTQPPEKHWPALRRPICRCAFNRIDTHRVEHWTVLQYDRSSTVRVCVTADVALNVSTYILTESFHEMGLRQWRMHPNGYCPHCCGIKSTSQVQIP